MRQEEFNQLIGYRLKEVQSLLRSRMEETLRPLGITVAQYVCLEILKSTPGASNAELARQAFVTRQTMNTLLRGLQERGLIERATHATKGRALPTMLTPQGEQMLAQATGRIREIEQHMVGGLSDAKRQELWDLLTICIEGLHTGGSKT
ncbi:MarR family transcriptional regulator [Rothia aeria]|nr:MarR family transcriptional regulator [Rothia aeria]